MDKFADDRDFSLLNSDKYTFFVLKRVLGYECDVILSDHENLIICHTHSPYPVWIWTKDDASKEDLKRAYDLTNEVLPIGKDYTYNVKYELADYFIDRALEDGKKMSVKTNMLAYDCQDPIRPDKDCDGKLHICTVDDVDELIEFMDLFHTETGIDRESFDVYRKKALESVENRCMYLWKNRDGKSVASCTFRPNGELGSVGLVYTRQEERRKNYASNLVYRVTKKAKEEGFLPMLYTDADYKASNACYEKIGYVKRGRLCTIGSAD